MRVAVIGAGGYIGRNLCRKLSAIGAEILPLSSSEPNNIFVETGLLSQSFKLPSQLDAVYYLAQSPHYRHTPEQSAHLLAVNCVAAVQAIEVARKAEARRFVYASTGNVYAASFAPLSESMPVRRNNWYSLSKVMAEDALALYQNSIDVSIARIFGVYGPGQTDKLIPNLIQAVKSGQLLFVDRNPHDLNDIDGLRVSFMFIDNLIDALITLSDPSSPSGVVNVGGDRPISLREIGGVLGHLLGVEQSVRLSEKNREGDLIADVSLLKKIIDIQYTDIEAGLSKTLAESKDGEKCVW